MNSKDKGCRGEREFAQLCREHGFDDARRGQQFQGGYESPDVAGLPGVHVEVKRAERLNISGAMRQAVRDCENKAIPIVAHRRNREDWLVTMRVHEWLELYKGVM